MAAIDKIYGTGEQQRELYYWLKYRKPSLLADLYFVYPDTLSNIHFAEPSAEDVTISNFRYVVDLWLMIHCPIDWVQENLQAQYSDSYSRNIFIYLFHRIENSIHCIPEFFSDVSIFGIKHAWEYYLLSIII